MWWALRYQSIFEQVVADFVQLYGVEPIFYLPRRKHQVFLPHPAQAIFVENATGLLADVGTGMLWNMDYREVKAFRPEDIAPQITTVLSGAMPREAWHPMVMMEVKVANLQVESFLATLASRGVFEQHWPAFRDAHIFRMFGEPEMLESLICAGISPAPLPLG